MIVKCYPGLCFNITSSELRDFICSQQAELMNQTKIDAQGLYTWKHGHLLLPDYNCIGFEALLETGSGWDTER